MKSVLLLSPFLLLLALIATNLPATLSRTAEMVMEYYKKPALTEKSYVFYPGMSVCGGVYADITSDTDCEVTVIRNKEEIMIGQPLKLSLPGTNGSAPGVPIFTGMAVDITFIRKPSCAESAKWIVLSDDHFPKKWVGIGGAKDHPGKKIIEGTFNVQKLSNSPHDSFMYKLEFCPKESHNMMTDKNVCFGVGMYDAGDYDGARLVLYTIGHHEDEGVYINSFGFDPRNDTST